VDGHHPSHPGRGRYGRKPKPSKRKKRPAPLLHPFIVECRIHSWYSLEVQGLQAGERVTKSGVAERQHVNLRELVRYFSRQGQQPGTAAERRIVEALHGEATRLQKMLAALNAPPEPEEITGSQPATA